jgi:triacylglycerol esterase/lipase EstA (alpha/beta hydrolase family)
MYYPPIQLDMLKENEKNIITIATITTLIVCAVFFIAAIQTAKVFAQTPAADNSTKTSKPLPVLLIHGYLADASTWSKWQDLLKKDGIPAYPITFKQSDDKCGSAAEHAKELSNQIAQIKSQTGQNKVNVVGHSKGGLDARVYLANGTRDVSNLIMIGTPNAGSPLAENNDICAPAIYDLKPGAPDTKVKINQNTKYYTIAGDWNPNAGNCDLSMFSFAQQSGSSSLPRPNDGLVPLASVESLGYSKSLGHSKSCHTNLLSEFEYGLAKNILMGGK